MTTRRDFIAAAALMTATAPIGSVFAQGTEQLEALFVQSAASATSRAATIRSRIPAR
jgi:hypothetical protein